MLKYTITADFESWEQISEKLTEYLTDCGFSRKSIISFMVAAEEIFANITLYAYGGKTGEAEVWLDILDGTAAKIDFWDSGVKFDPTSAENPVISAPSKTRPIGGMGIYMAKKKTDEMLYEYKNGKNHLTLIKKLQ
ncbi:MAG: ATP-binding protein [Clostridiales bacterium]|nr:ATP-binding protein [Clostridiales bacterium]